MSARFRRKVRKNYTSCGLWANHQLWAWCSLLFHACPPDWHLWLGKLVMRQQQQSTTIAHSTHKCGNAVIWVSERSLENSSAIHTFFLADNCTCPQLPRSNRPTTNATLPFFTLNGLLVASPFP